MCWCGKCLPALSDMQDHYLATMLSYWPEHGDELVSLCVGCDHMPGAQGTTVSITSCPSLHCPDAEAQARTITAQLASVATQPEHLHTATTDNTNVMPATCDVLGVEQVHAPVRGVGCLHTPMQSTERVLCACHTARGVKWPGGAPIAVRAGVSATPPILPGARRGCSTESGKNVVQIFKTEQ